MTAECNILISSVGRRGELIEIFRAALDEMKVKGRVLAADASRRSPGFHLADEGFLVPRCDDTEFVPRMLELCQANAVNLVVPTIDTELPAYASNREAFARIGAVVAVSSREAVDITLDKWATHRWLCDSGLPTVEQASIDEVRASPGRWLFPLLVKPVRGNSSRGVAVVHDLPQLDVATRDGAYIVQSIAKGLEHTVDVLVDGNGDIVCAVPRRRLEVRAGEVSKALTVRSAALQDVARRACSALPGAFGVLNVQAFIDDADDVRVIELNARFGGGFPLAWAAGARYPTWMLQELLGIPPTATADGWRDGLVMLRYDQSVFVEADECT